MEQIREGTEARTDTFDPSYPQMGGCAPREASATPDASGLYAGGLAPSATKLAPAHFPRQLAGLPTACLKWRQIAKPLNCFTSAVGLKWRQTTKLLYCFTSTAGLKLRQTATLLN